MRVVVLGAGYAGLAAAARLAARVRRVDVEVVLVNATDRFVERVRLHQRATGQGSVDHRLAEVLRGTAVQLEVARASAIDTRRQVLVLEDGGEVDYDVLVYAPGSGPDLDSVPGVREHAHAVADPSSADALHARLATTDDGVVVVVGGGLTGIETAAEIADVHPALKVELVTSGRPGEWLGGRAERYVDKALRRLGVEVVSGVRVHEVDASGIRLHDGRRIASALTVWAAGFGVPRIAANAGIEVDESGRMVVDRWLRSVSHPEISGAGDAVSAAAVGGGRTRMSCQTGLPMGVQVADTIARRLTGRTARPVRIRYVWQNISLGRHDAVTQFTRKDDTPVGAVLTGRPAAWFKEFISWSAGYATRHAGMLARRY